MFDVESVLGARTLRFEASEFRALQKISVPLEWDTTDRLELMDRLLGDVVSRSAEGTACSPVISHAELERIRNNVVNQYNALRNGYSNIGASLDARGCVAQYNAVFDATEGGNYCYYQNDQYLVDDIVNSARGANAILRSAGNQYANNFNAKLSPMRSAFSQLQQAANAATNDIGPSLNAYKQFWNLNFDFHLYNGLNNSLDSWMAEYGQLCNSSNAVFDQGNARVQGNFEAEARTNNLIYSAFLQAYNVWDTQDGAQGYAAYADQFTPFRNSLALLSRFVVLDTPLNKQIFDEINLHVDKISKTWKSFPNFPQAMASTGFVLDPNTSSLKFYARQQVLNTAQGAGAYFNRTIAPGESLIGTGFSYQHGGKMPPHAEHKDGKDCDLFSKYFKVGGADYSEKKAKDMVVFLLSNPVTRVIYTNANVVKAANLSVPGNAVAVVGAGHETHIHFDMDNATILIA